MADEYLKTKPLSLSAQLLLIRDYYHEILEASEISKGVLKCILRLQPSADCKEYRVLVKYKISDYSPKAWILSPELKTNGDKAPHHLYGYDENGHPLLCVYDPRCKEWNQQMSIAKAFIPWIITWLNTYEYWLITGEWDYPEAGNAER